MNTIFLSFDGHREKICDCEFVFFLYPFYMHEEDRILKTHFNKVNSDSKPQGAKKYQS